MTGYALTVALNAAVDTTYLLDGFAIGAIHTAAAVSRVAGGKANNVARVLRMLGAPVVATGFAGGHAGGFIRAHLEAQGIAADFEPIPGESRTCLALVDRTGRTLTEVREPGPAVPPEAQASFLDRFRRLVRGARAVVISGSLPPGVPDDFYAHLVAAARAAGAFTVVDTSGRALPPAMAAGPDLVKPNRDELAAWLAGAPAVAPADAGSSPGAGPAGAAPATTPSPGATGGAPLPPLDSPGAVRAAAEAMRAAGARAVAVSLGAAGLVYTGPAGAFAVRPPAVAVVNTVGSGDSLVAGIVAGLLRGLPLPEALRLGVACGTANALTDAVASPRLEDIERILPTVTVAPL